MEAVWDGLLNEIVWEYIFFNYINEILNSADGWDYPRIGNYIFIVFFLSSWNCGRVLQSALESVNLKEM